VTQVERHRVAREQTAHEARQGTVSRPQQQVKM
jgi:hypothetical protein